MTFGLSLQRTLDAIVLFVVATALVVIPAISVSASNYDTYCIDEVDCSIYDPTCFSDTGEFTPSSGKDNNAKVYNFLREKGLGAEDAAAIVGNFIHESGKDPIDPNGKNPGSGAYGIAQWLGGRLTGLVAYAEKKNKPRNDIDLQLNYLWEVDIPANEKSFHSLAKLKAAKGIAAKATSWEATFERAGGAGIPQRVEKAKKILAEYGSGGGGSSSTGVEAAEGGADCGPSNEESNTAVGDFSLPVAGKWYKEHPDWFTKPHHDYPAADIPVPSGTKIFSASKGKVVAAVNSGYGGGAGTHAFIKDGEVVYGYFHGTPGSLKVKNGDEVKPGQLLMLSDNTGHSFGDHLHFQIEVGGAKHCPQKFLDAIGKGKAPPDPKSLPTQGCSN